ncbi:MAG: ABC transporter ATP-binding protein [Bacteroidia bacterium]
MRISFSNNILVLTLSQLRKWLSPKEKTHALLLLLGIAVGGITDVLSVAMFVPVIMMIANPDLISEQKYLSLFHEYFGEPSLIHFILMLLLCILIFFIIKTVYLLFIQHMQAQFAFNLSTRLSEKQVKRYFAKDYLFLKNNNSYGLVNNAMNVPTLFAFGIMIPGLSFFSELMIIILIGIGIGIYNLKLLIFLAVVLGPVIFISYYFIKNQVSRLGKKQIKLQPVAYESLHQAFKGFVDLKLHGKEEFFSQQFVQRQSGMHRLMTSIYTYNAAPHKILELGAVLAISLIFFYTLYFAGYFRAPIVFLSIFAAAAYRLLPSFNRIIGALISMKNYRHTIDILRESDEPAEAVQEKDTAAALPFALDKEIKVENVSFAYENMKGPLLDKLSFTIRKGDTLGIFGESGAGKSTFLYLLLRFLKPASGKIVVDGKDYSDIALADWHKHIGLVKQDLFVVNGSVEENIALGTEPAEVDRDKLAQAVKQAGLSDLVATLPSGLATEMGEGGVRFSSGQLQRIGIARALYKDADILLFDEATNAIDMETEQEILHSLRTLKSLKKTIIIIAHRMSTLKVCNRIILLKKGKALREYNYPELIASLTPEEFNTGEGFTQN